MFTQRSDDLLHRFDLAPHRADTPLIQELYGPARTAVLPKPLEVLPQQMAANALEIVLQEFGQLHRLLFRAVLGTFQQAPAGMLQHRLVAVLRQSPGLLSPDLID